MSSLQPRMEMLSKFRLQEHVDGERGVRQVIEKILEGEDDVSFPLPIECTINKQAELRTNQNASLFGCWL